MHKGFYINDKLLVILIQTSAVIAQTSPKRLYIVESITLLVRKDTK